MEVRETLEVGMELETWLLNKKIVNNIGILQDLKTRTIRQERRGRRRATNFPKINGDGRWEIDDLQHYGGLRRVRYVRGPWI